MKLLFAIVQNDDQKSLTYALIEKNISVTRIASTGGFLRGGNSTLMIGVEADRLEETLSIINSDRDLWGAIKWKDYYDTYRLVTALLVYNDDFGVPPAPPSEP